MEADRDRPLGVHDLILMLKSAHRSQPDAENRTACLVHAIRAQESLCRRGSVNPKAGRPAQVAEGNPEAIVVADDRDQRHGAHSRPRNARIGRRFNRLLVVEGYDCGMTTPSPSVAASLVSWW